MSVVDKNFKTLINVSDIGCLFDSKTLMGIINPNVIGCSGSKGHKDMC